jgi:hypothetical protein
LWKTPLFRLTVLGASASLGMILWLGHQAQASAPDPDAMRQIEATFAANPDLAKLYAAFESKRPQVYPELMRRTSGALSRGDAMAASYGAFAIMRRPIVRDEGFLDRADEGSLAAWFQSAETTLSAFQDVSPKLCGQTVVGGGGRGPLPDEPKLFAAIDGWIATTIEAVHAGETSPQTYQKISESDAITVAQLLMMQNLSIEDIKSLGAPDALQKLPEDQRCPALVRLVRTILSAPEPSRNHFLGQSGAAAARHAGDVVH